jgi:hypothetical protein
MNLNKLTEIFGAIAGVLFVIVVISAGYSLATNEDDDDEDSVTITYHCPTVLASQEKYDTFLVQQCNELYGKDQ